MLSNVVSLVFHIILAYLLVAKMDLGIKGIAIATSVNYFVRFIVLQVFIYYSRFNEHLISLFRRRSRRHLIP